MRVQKQPVTTEEVDSSGTTTSTSSSSSSGFTSSSSNPTTEPVDTAADAKAPSEDAGGTQQDPESDAGNNTNGDGGAGSADAASPDGAVILDAALDAARPAFPLTADGSIDTESCEYRCDQAGGICRRGNNDDPADDRCVIACDDAECMEEITCPTGLHCEVSCGRGACDGLITALAAETAQSPATAMPRAVVALTAPTARPATSSAAVTTAVKAGCAVARPATPSIALAKSRVRTASIATRTTAT